jgi:hypothetical protein
MRDMVVRNGTREVLAILLALRDHITKPDIAEAIVVLKLVNRCRELGFYMVVLKCDTLPLVQAFKKNGES